MKRLIATLIIFFLLGVTGLPFLSWSGDSYFAYATEEQEQLTTEEIIEAGIIAYLNERKAWIVNQTGNSIDTVKAVMQSYINAYDYWKSEPVGELTTLAANIIIRYSPFRISLKGPAVRAFNDLYNWLVDTGKLPNLNDSSGGETSDNLYDGLITRNSLYYVVKNSSYSNNDVQAGLYNTSDITIGSPVSGITGDSIFNQYLQQNNLSSSTFNNQSLTNYDIGINSSNNIIINVNYFSDYSYSLSFGRARSTISGSSSFSPGLTTGNGITITQGITNSSKNNINIYVSSCYSEREHKLIGNPAYILTQNSNGNNYLFCGFALHDLTDDTVLLRTFHRVVREDYPNDIQSADVNFDTDDFDKTDPTPPEGDEELELTPRDKTTGDTFNTYNEYITNYVTKNTVINNNNSGGGSDPDPEEPPGGTTPPWTDNGSSGTLTPNGNGGFDLSLPDLTLPDLDIDWSINGLKDKFPFSIPWDLMAFFTVLNAEPETPHFEGTIPIGIWEWEIDWDLHYFDNLAILVRNLEFIAFCIGLIIVTRNIIKG